MNSHLARLLVLSAVWLVPQLAMAESWIFRPSYYSHDPVEKVRIGRQYAGGPVFSRPQGAYVSGGWRWQHAPITIGGQMYDNYNYFESWISHGEQW